MDICLLIAGILLFSLCSVILYMKRDSKRRPQGEKRTEVKNEKV